MVAAVGRDEGSGVTPDATPCHVTARVIVLVTDRVIPGCLNGRWKAVATLLRVLVQGLGVKV